MACETVMMIENHVTWDDDTEMSLPQLQSLLAAGELDDVDDIAEPLRIRLENLAAKLCRIRSWGGMFAQVAFSPEMECLLEAVASQKAMPDSSLVAS